MVWGGQERCAKWWPRACCSSLFDGNHGEIHPRKTDYTDSGVPFIMASDLHNGVVDTVRCRFISRWSGRLAQSRIRSKTATFWFLTKAPSGDPQSSASTDDYIMLTPAKLRPIAPRLREELQQPLPSLLLHEPSASTGDDSAAGGGSTRCLHRHHQAVGGLRDP